jgi:hypothetical protein
MRKLILITVIATMSTTSCYANLSLASNEPAPAATEQPKPQAPETRPATVAKSPSVAKPRRSHVSRWATPIPVRGFYQHCL